jgi:hypothetical protein
MTEEEKSSRGLRAHQVPAFKEPSDWMQAERERLHWVPRGTVRIVQGIKTSGGFYVHCPKKIPFSFAVDESLPVGRAENARSFPLRPGRSIAYRQLNYRELHPDQRAVYLLWLSGAGVPAEAVGFCVLLHVAALEWRLFIDRADPSEVISELLDVLDCPARGDEGALVGLLVWTAYFQDSGSHLAVWEEIIAAGCQAFDGSMVRLLLLDCADAKRPVWPELALTVQTLFRGCHWTFSGAILQKRFLERFTVLYPDGLLISAGPRRTEVEYHLHCVELRGERCRLVIPDSVENALSALREVAAPLLVGERLDPVKLQITAEETSRSQAYLTARFNKYSETEAVPAPPKVKTASVLDETVVQVLRTLIERPHWTKPEFHALARSYGLMPFALQERVNGLPSTISARLCFRARVPSRST